MKQSETVLEIKDLCVEFQTVEGKVQAVDHLNYTLHKGEKLGIVGESGSGKSVSSLAVLQLIPNPPGRVTGGEILYKGKDLVKLSEKEMQKLRGNEVSMIFQEPMTSLNPIIQCGKQIAESLRLHRGMNKKEAMQEAVNMMRAVGIANPEVRAHEYPHQMSGGMRQRVMIAMALACEPDILIADEPTTALDVTIQAQILELMKELQQKLGMAIIMVTHDLGVIATMCDEIMVMYGGRVCERGTADDIFYNPRHEYTKGLLRSIPSTERMKERLVPIAGNPINLLNMPAGCAFCARCDRALKVCLDYVPMERQVGEGHRAACWLNDLALKDEAEKMIAAGQSAEAVQAATGWVKDENGQWVFDPVINEQEGGSGNEQ